MARVRRVTSFLAQLSARSELRALPGTAVTALGCTAAARTMWAIALERRPAGSCCRSAAARAASDTCAGPAERRDDRRLEGVFVASDGRFDVVTLDRAAAARRPATRASSRSSRSAASASPAGSRDGRGGGTRPRVRAACDRRRSRRRARLACGATALLDAGNGAVLDARLQRHAAPERRPVGARRRRGRHRLPRLGQDAASSEARRGRAPRSSRELAGGGRRPDDAGAERRGRSWHSCEKSAKNPLTT